MAKYTVIAGPLDHDGERFQEGAKVELSEAAAAALLHRGVIAPTGRKAALAAVEPDQAPAGEQPDEPPQG